MKNFVYDVPTRIYFGSGEHKNVGKIIAEYGFHNVLLHYGSGSIKKNGSYDDIVASLIENGIRFCELGGVEPNPKLSLVREGVRICRSEAIELVLAVGGGSVIDSAKAIAFTAPGAYDTWEYYEGRVKPYVHLPVATVLTIAASGSEMSNSCVITNDEIACKRGCSTQLNRPLFSILNPELTYTVSPYQTACGIVDIMMHTLERYLTNHGSFSPTDDIAEAIVKSTMANGVSALEDPTNFDARAALMWNGSLSHNGLTALGRDYFMISHQIEHEVSGMYDRVAHGAGLAVIFPAWCRWAYRFDTDRFYRFARRIMEVEDGATKEETILSGIEKLECFFRSIGMPTRFSELDIDSSVFPVLAEKCTRKGTRLLPGYVNYTEKEIVEILKLAE